MENTKTIKDLKDLRLSGVPQTKAMLSRIGADAEIDDEALIKRYDAIQKYLSAKDLEFLNDVDKWLLEDAALPVTVDQLTEFHENFQLDPEQTARQTLESFLYDSLYTGNVYICSPKDSEMIDLNSDNFGIEAKLFELRRTHPSDYYRLTQILGYAAQKALLNNEFKTNDISEYDTEEGLGTPRQTAFCIPSSPEFNTESVQKHNVKEFMNYLTTQTNYDSRMIAALQRVFWTREEFELANAPSSRQRYQRPEYGVNLSKESRFFQLYSRRGSCVDQAEALVVGLRSLGVEASGIHIRYGTQSIGHSVARVTIGNKKYIADPTIIQTSLIPRKAEDNIQRNQGSVSNRFEEYLKNMPEDLQKKYKTIEDFSLVEEDDYYRILEKFTKCTLYLHEVDYSEMIESDARHDRISRTGKNELHSAPIRSEDESVCALPVRATEHKNAPLQSVPSATWLFCLGTDKFKDEILRLVGTQPQNTTTTSAVVNTLNNEESQGQQMQLDVQKDSHRSSSALREEFEKRYFANSQASIKRNLR